ncbi:protein SGT1 homolog [Glandiceps talaboti]
MAELFSKANEAFVDENYGEAVKLYEQAIEQDGQNAEYYLKRAQAYIKLEQYPNAVNDAQKAIDLVPNNAKAYLRKGTACFYLERYDDARKAFMEGQRLDQSDSTFKTWIRKCEAELNLEEMEESGPTAEGKPIVGVASGSTDSTPVSTQQTEPKSNTQTESTSNVQTETSTATPSETTNETTAASPVSQPPVAPKIRYDWYQTETHVVITIMIKKAKKEDVTLKYTDKTVSASVRLPTDTNYNLDLSLAHCIVPDKSLHKVLSTKIEVKLKKADGLRWNMLEAPAEEKKVIKKADISQDDVHKYPSSSHHGKDWDKLAKDVEKEEKDSKLEGDAALNQLFQQIYTDGTDEVRRAMNKSFSESGGTVLSTNWQDIAKKKTEVKPPDGMEWKDWE